jgi:hypothetical protein
MKYIQIQTPCSEDWNAMKPNEKGAFCQSCAKNVLDLTRMSTSEIHSVLRQNQYESICTRIQNRQLDALNHEYDRWSRGTRFHMQRAMVASLLIVFGLTLFSCTDEQQQKQIRDTQEKLTEIVNQKEQQTNVQSSDSVHPFDVFTVDSIDILGEVTMGEPDIQIQEEVSQKEEIERISKMRHVTMGAIAMQTVYTEYVEQIRPVIEYDAAGNQIPTTFSAKAFPNPANEQSTLELGIPVAIDANIFLYSNQGQLINPIYSGKIERGTFQQTIDFNDLEPGIYLVVIQSKALNETVRIIKL